MDADKDCTISTHDLFVDSPPDTSLSVVARPGPDNLSGGKPTEPLGGQNAGALSVYVENCSSSVTSGLRVLAKGGDGGDTREKGATAGDGGQGGHVQFVAYHAMMGISSLLDLFARSGYDGLKSRITINHPAYLDLVAILKTAQVNPGPSQSASSDSLITLVKPVQNFCDRISDPTDSVTIDNAKDVVWEVRQKLQSQFSSDSTQLRTGIRVDGGEAGSYLGGSDGSRGSAGKPGKVGTIEPYIFLRAFDDERLRNQTLVSVHPEQCEMLYERAMTYWYFGTNTSRQKAAQLLERLLFRVRFLPLKDSHPLHQVDLPLFSITFNSLMLILVSRRILNKKKHSRPPMQSFVSKLSRLLR